MMRLENYEMATAPYPHAARLGFSHASNSKLTQKEIPEPRFPFPDWSPS